MISLMNRIKTDLRSRMRNDRISGTLTVSRLALGLDTPVLEELDKWISFWDLGRKTGRYTTYHK